MKKLVVLLIMVTIIIGICADIIPVNNQESGGIQAGITIASDGDTVLVYPGTYIENINFNSKEIVVASLYLTTGDTTYITQTIIDGNGSANAVVIENTTNLQTLLTGFTIQNGNALEVYPENGYPEQIYGGGIFCRNAYVNLSNLIIKNNVANRGGGIAFIENSQSFLTGIKIIDNEALPNNLVDGYGGGIYVKDSNIEIEFNNEISSNNASAHGGGIYILDDANVYFMDTCLNNNTAYQGAGIYVDNSALNYHEGVISGNTSTSDGAGIFLDHSTYSYVTNTNLNFNISSGNGGGVYVNGFNSEINTRFQGCIIENNSALKGGGIFCHDEDIDIENIFMRYNVANFKGGGIYLTSCDSVVINNSSVIANFTNEKGAGIWADNCHDFLIQSTNISDNSIGAINGQGGGIICSNIDNLRIDESDIDSNSSNYGAALFIDTSNVSMNKSIITNNEDIYDQGSIVFTDNSQLKIINTTIADNIGTETEVANIFVENSDLLILNSIVYNPVNGIKLNSSSNLTITYSDLKDGEEAIFIDDSSSMWLEANIAGNPLFLEGAGNYCLSEYSPCIDAGINYFQWNGEEVINLDPESYYGSNIDMGCYESNYTGGDIDKIIPVNIKLNNYPNPFNPETTISFSLNKPGRTELTIYNIKGQKVQTLLNDQLDPGRYEIVWNGKDQNNRSVSSGVYFYKLQSGRHTATKKMILMK